MTRDQWTSYCSAFFKSPNYSRCHMLNIDGDPDYYCLHYRDGALRLTKNTVLEAEGRQALALFDAHHERYYGYSCLTLEHLL